MPTFKRQSKATAELHVLPHSGSLPHDQRDVWLSNEDICGRAVFKLAPNVDFTHSQVQLKGVVTTRTVEGPDSLSRSVRTEKLPFLGVVKNSKANSGFKSNDGIVRIPFRFNLDDIHSEAQSSFVTDLPPSLNSRSEKVRWTELGRMETEAGYDVTYSIAATVFSGRGQEASTEKTIQVLPVSQGEDSRSPADCPGEYHLASPSPQRRSVSLSKAQSKIEVSGQQPEAISLSAHDSFSNNSTTIPFVLKALPVSSSEFDLKSLPTQCEVKARLLTKTLITSDGIEQAWIAIIEQGRHAENTCLRTQNSEEQEGTINLQPWQHVVPNTGEQFAISKFSFDFDVTTDQALVSTFFTPLLSRRYAIEISIRYPGTSNPGTKLTLPLHVSYDTDESDNEKIK